MELQLLIEAVESGDFNYDASFMGEDQNIMVLGSFTGSLDAAKELHDALLPGWFFEVADDSACVWEYRQYDAGVWSARNPCPARAWLLAILKAYQQVQQ